MIRTTGFFFCLILLTPMFAVHADEETATVRDENEQSMLHFGGCGGVYFLVEPGEFWVELEKYDRNIKNSRTFLRAILAGPDRSVLAEQTLADDGLERGAGPGPIQRARLSTQVPRKGVYALNITVSEDRYGENIAWGFRTNCPHYLVETSRGHRDAPHQEPLVLLSPDAPGDVCFMPERDAFVIEVSGINANTEPPRLYNGVDDVIGTLELDAEGNGRYKVTADVPRASVPWRLHLPGFQGTAHIDGVTRWPGDNDFPNLSLWTPDKTSWFPLHQNRWLLTPYTRNVYSESGAYKGIAFHVHNNDFVPRTFTLSVEFPGRPWQVALSVPQVVVNPKDTATVTLDCVLPDTVDTANCHLRASPEDTPAFSTYATVTLHRDTPPYTQPLDLPLVLKPYSHENAQFGYLPQYPTDNQVYFRADRRPFIVSDTTLQYWHDNAWTSLSDVIQGDGPPVSFRARSSKIAFDNDNTAYMIGDVEKQTVLLYAHADDARLNMSILPGRGAVDMEQFSGNNPLDGPPPLVRYTLTEKDPNVFWRRLNDLALFLPIKGADGVISVGEPILISQKCIGFSAHSGIPSSVVSRDGKVHVAWAEATDPDEEFPGVPTFVATYDRDTKQLGKPALVGYGPPANDCHNTPSITMDSQGYLHVLIGTHGRTFQYARSLRPNDASNWTEPEELGPGLRQTYVGLVCDNTGALHVVFRLWFHNDQKYFPAGHYATLAYMRKRPGEPWSTPQVLVVSPFSEYGIFYHRLTIDHDGRLFLSYDCWSTYWFYRMDHRGTRRALMMSSDGGDTWRLAGMDALNPLK